MNIVVLILSTVASFFGNWYTIILWLLTFIKMKNRSIETAQSSLNSKSVWKSLLEGSRTSTFFSEVLSNSGHFSILKG